MKNTTINANEIKKTHAHTLSKSRYMEIVETFKAFVKDKKNHPKIDERYGTKYNFRINIEHFILYAILRNKEPSKTSHDPESSEKYMSAMRSLELLSRSYSEERENWYYKDTFAEAFGISELELHELLKEYFSN